MIFLSTTEQYSHRVDTRIFTGWWENACDARGPQPSLMTNELQEAFAALTLKYLCVCSPTTAFQLEEQQSVNLSNQYILYQ